MKKIYPSVFASVVLLASSLSVFADDGVVCTLQSNCISRLTDCAISAPIPQSGAYWATYSFVYDVQSKYSCVTSSGTLVQNSGIVTNTPSSEDQQPTASDVSAKVLSECQSLQAQLLLQYDGRCAQ